MKKRHKPLKKPARLQQKLQKCQKLQLKTCSSPSKDNNCQVVTTHVPAVLKNLSRIATVKALFSPYKGVV